MSRYWTTSLTALPRATMRFVGAWAVLTVLPFLPSLASPLPVSPYFPLCIEVLVLVTGVAYSAGTNWQRPVQISALIGLGILVAYESYDALVYTAFQRSGLLYEDVQFVDNLAYFVHDLLSWRVAGAALLGLVALAAVGKLAWWCLQIIAQGGGQESSRFILLLAHLLAWPLVGVVGPALELGSVNLTYQTSNDRTRVRTVTTKAVANMQASLRLDAMLDSLQSAPIDSTYTTYDTLSLDRRPSVYLLAIESYGSVLNRHPDLRAPYRRVMQKTEAMLADAGWHMATARCAAPVRGGRSWLAIASLLTGVRVNHQLLFNRFQETPDDVPHLVRFLNRQGYRTVTLQPLTMERPGLPVRNLYDFDVTLYQNDLHYEGPPYGLANAPDQYSLNFAHDTQIAGWDSPFFLFFESVSSHSLWNYGLPPYLENWRAFNAVEGSYAEQRRLLAAQGQPPSPALPDSITVPTIYDQPTPVRYLRHIGYDLRVLRDYLTEKASAGSLVLILGDHQPPLLDTTTDTVPLHVLSTDPALVDQFRRHGFTDGLLPTEETARVRQEGLYSLLVRLLAAHDRGNGPAADTTGLPTLRPNGVSPSLLAR